MRGIVTAAMLSALADDGYTSCFDEIHSASAGAMNAVYFVSGDSWIPLSLYYDDLATKKFIDFGRLLTGKSFIDLDFAFERAATRPWNADAVLRSSQRIVIAVTDVDAVATHWVDTFESEMDLREALYASCWIPHTTTKTGEWRGMRAIDGSVLSIHPVRAALATDCTHLLSLSSRRIGSVKPRHSPLQFVAAMQLNRLGRGLGKSYLRAIRNDWADRAQLSADSNSRISPRPVLDLAPLPWMQRVERHHTNARDLLLAARQSYGLAACLLNGWPLADLESQRVRVVPRLTAVPSPLAGA